MLRSEGNYDAMRGDVTTFHPTMLRGFLIIFVGLGFLFTFLQSMPLSEAKIEKKVYLWNNY